MALLRGQLTPADYQGQPWRDAAVLNLMARIRLIEEREWERAQAQEGIIGCRLIARLRDGTERAAEVREPAGHPDASLSDDQLVAKLDEILAGRLGEGGARRLLAACDALPDAPNLADLFAALSPAEAPST